MRPSRPRSDADALDARERAFVFNYDPDDESTFDDNNPLAHMQGRLIDYFTQRSDKTTIKLSMIVRRVTDDYIDLVLASRHDSVSVPRPQLTTRHLLTLADKVIDAVNESLSKRDAMRHMSRPTTWQLAQLLIRLHHVICIPATEEAAGTSRDLLAMYVTDGPRKGTYTTSPEQIRALARRYDQDLNRHEAKDLIEQLHDIAPRVPQTVHPDLVPVNNGVFHYGTEPMDIRVNGQDLRFEPKALHPFTPDLVLLSKARADYVDNPEPVFITMPDGEPWEVTDWIEDLFDYDGGEGLADLVWEVIGAALRPYVPWGKAAWFYSESGANGKGTLCQLITDVLGPSSCASIPLSDFSGDFSLEPLVGASAIIVHENDVGTFVDRAANLKAVVTGDTVAVKRKFKDTVDFVFHGFMIQCLNEMPRIHDRSGSFARRQLFIPFEKSFVGSERKYIRTDYLRRPEVLRYVLWYAMNRAGHDSPGSYYGFSSPAATSQTLMQFREMNDPVREFWSEMRDRFTWDLLPFTFLYDLYKAWFARNNPQGKPLSNKRFINDLTKGPVREDEHWTYEMAGGRFKKYKAQSRITVAEPLIAEYGLGAPWVNPTYGRGGDPDKIGLPAIHRKTAFRGLIRATATATDTEEED